MICSVPTPFSGAIGKNFAVVGFSRSEQGDEQYRAAVKQTLQANGLVSGEDSRLNNALYYESGDSEDPHVFERLSSASATTCCSW